jgi:hypothetical protein
MKKPILIIAILLVVTLTLSIVRIYISNQIATSGVMLGQVQSGIDAYKMQNILLAEKLYSDSSLANIAQEASKEGFIAQSSDFVLNGQIPVAFKQ